MDLLELKRALEAAFFAEAEGPDGAHDIHHMRRVWRNARQIAEVEGEGALHILMAGAYLHDIVNLPKDAPDRHRASAQSGAKAARILESLGFCEDDVAAARHAIRAHSFSAGIAPETVEAQILQDADRLEALGALGLARTFHIGGQLGSALFDGDDPFAEGRALDDRAYVLDHFETKLFRLPERFHTGAARAMAAPRLALMREFLEALRAELAES